MARFILRWNYNKAGETIHNRNYIKYMGTRDGVEKCDESWKFENVTTDQMRFIKLLTTDFPWAKNSFEYEDYLKNPTKYTASVFIAEALDENIHLIGKRENYINYIAKRPRVEKMGTHGLFTQEDKAINVENVANTIAQHQGIVWTTILSLRREDAERLGYDNAKAWRDMLRAKSVSLAKHMRIPYSDLRWYAAFHNERHHPHVHLVSYSVGKSPYITEKGLKKFKTEFGNAIFKDELYYVYEEKTAHRDQLREESKKRIEEIVGQIQSGTFQTGTVEMLLQALTTELDNYKGKLVYGYIPKKAKNLIDGIVDEIAKDKRIEELYDLWYSRKEHLIAIYQTKIPDRIPLSKNEEFRPIRNAVLKEAIKLSRTLQTERPNHFSIEPIADSDDHEEASILWKGTEVQVRSTSSKTEESDRVVASAGMASLRLFARITQMLGDSLDNNVDLFEDTADSKLKEAIREKKKAHGLRM